MITRIEDDLQEKTHTVAVAAVTDASLHQDVVAAVVAACAAAAAAAGMKVSAA